MDRSNKYYSIIENLVRNHRKFPGLEAIAEDIIDDVYKHTESILESIDDEMVINGYLQKIVSTSIITVPKKLNFHNEIRHRYIPSEYTPIMASTDISAPAQAKKTEEKQEENIAGNTEINELENSIDENLPQDEKEEELIIDNTATEDLTEYLEADNIPEQEQEQERPDNSLVDKMINSITEDTLKDEGISQKEEDADEDNLLEEIADVQADLNTGTIIADEIEDEVTDVEELVSYSDVSDVENLSDLQVENSIADNTKELIIDEDSASEEIAAKEEPEEEISVAEETEENIIFDEESNIFLDEENETEELKVDIEDVEQANFDIIEEDSIEDNLTQEEQEEENDTIDFSQEEGELLELNDYDDESSLELSETISFENQEEDDNELLIASEENTSMYEDENNEISMLEEDDSISITLDSDDSESDIILDEETEDEAVISNNDGFKPIDYSAFNFNPENKAIITDNNYMAEKLLETDQEEPNLNMLKIFDLKYKQNLTIEEISEMLNIEKQDVVAALDKMVDLI